VSRVVASASAAV
jgi:hypothetical protein